MSDYFRLSFRDVDGHIAYVGASEEPDHLLGITQQFGVFVTDINVSACFDEESCAVVKNTLEEYWKNLLPSPIYFSVDRVF